MNTVSAGRIFPPLFRMTTLPEHCSSTLSTNRVDDSYWLAPRSPAQPVTASPLTHCKSYQNPSHRPTPLVEGEAPFQNTCNIIMGGGGIW